MSILQFRENPTLGLYIHLPWCVEKCPYCDFNSHGLKGERPPEKAYIQCLLKDVERELPLIWGRPIETIFIGGGTPSLFSVTALDQLLSGLRALLDLRFTREITLEANPGTDIADKLAELRAIGINRLSVGVQSFADAQLKQLGRIHSAFDAVRTIEAAQKAGFERINIDLMHGLPGQTPQAARADLQQALGLEVSHISWYQLTIEPHTAFAAFPPQLPEDDSLAEIYDQGRALLEQHGFERYEVSAFCRNGDYCEHNRNYWQFGDYLGIGAGAHGKITLPAEARIERRRRSAHPNAYMQAVANGEGIIAENIPRRELAFEFMLNALRMPEGVPADLFQLRTGQPLAVIRHTLTALEEDELIEWGLNHIRPTERGLDYLNDVLQRFLPKVP